MKNRIYRKYIEFGAFPYVTQLEADRILVQGLSVGLVQHHRFKDVFARRKISDVMMLESVVNF